jgi:hypothetical protein
VIYLFHTPRPPLDRYVERLWLVTGGQAPRRDRILPSGTIELVINLLDDRVRIDRTERCANGQSYSGAVVSGTYSSAFVVDAAQHAAMMGVHFRPGGAPPVLGVPAGALTDAHVDLAALWGESAVRLLRERLCGALTSKARACQPGGVSIRRYGWRSPASVRMAADRPSAMCHARPGSAIGGC